MAAGTAGAGLKLITTRINSCVSHGAYAILQDTEPKVPLERLIDTVVSLLVEDGQGAPQL